MKTLLPIHSIAWSTVSALFLSLSAVASAETYNVTLVGLKNSDGDPEHDLYLKVVADGKTTKIPSKPSKDHHFVVPKYTTEALSSAPGVWVPSEQKPKASDLSFKVEKGIEVSLWDYNGLLAAGVDGNKGFIQIDLKPGTYTELLKPLNFRSDLSGGVLATQYTLSYTVSKASGGTAGKPSAAKGHYQIAAAAGAKLKNEAKEKARVIATLPKGEWVNFVSQSDDWRLVKVVSTGKVGWVKRTELGEYHSN